MGKRVKNCGLFVCLTNGILAASPDGLVKDDGIIEIKCPASIIGFPPTDLPKKMKTGCYLKPKSKDNCSLQVCWSSAYYRQVIMQLHVTGKQWCDFVVYSFKEGAVREEFEPFIERIYANDTTLATWNDMQQKLVRFYMEDLAPEIIDSWILRNMDIRQPQYHLDALKSKVDALAIKASRKKRPVKTIDISRKKRKE